MMGFPRWLAFPPALGALLAIVLVAYRVWRDRHDGLRFPLGDLLWAFPQVVLLVLVAAFAVGGSLGSDVGKLEIAAFSILISLCVAVVLTRRRVAADLAGLSVKLATAIRALIACVTLLFVSVASAWMVDFAWMESIGGIQLQFFGLTAGLFLVLGAALYFIGQRSGALVSVVPLCAAGFGIAQYFVVMFKGTPIMPMDLLSLKTAGAIAAGYEYELTSNMVRVLCAVGVSLCVLSYVRSGDPHGSRKVRFGLGVVSVGAGLALIIGLVTFFNGAKLEERLGVEYDRWMPITTYRTIGFVPAFIEIAQDFKISEPAGYDRDDVEDRIAELADEFDRTIGSTPERQAAMAQFDEVKPTVIGIMNETFSDQSEFEGIRAAGYEGPKYYQTLGGALQRGPLKVSVYGGGTANTEFEFLTGNAMAFIGTSKYAYQLYDLSMSDSLVKQFEKLGYRSVAMHPQDPLNWKRSTAYKQLGFDEFISIEDFEGAPAYHAGVTDAATYEKILDLLEADEAPQFIFDVTMQNHGGYGPGSVPAEDVVHLDIPGVSPDVTESLGVYLACIERSDNDLACFVERLRALDRPVVLVFFGDHQPGMDQSLYDALAASEDVAGVERKKFETTYAVWSNYEIAGTSTSPVRDVGASQLAASVLYKIGAPLTDRQKADLALDQSIVGLNAACYAGPDGRTYPLDSESPWRGALELKRTIQYARFAEIV